MGLKIGNLIGNFIPEVLLTLFKKNQNFGESKFQSYNLVF
jgi:hypothetical protein